MCCPLLYPTEGRCHPANLFSSFLSFCKVFVYFKTKLCSFAAVMQVGLASAQRRRPPSIPSCCCCRHLHPPHSSYSRATRATPSCDTKTAGKGTTISSQTTRAASNIHFESVHGVPFPSSLVGLGRGRGDCLKGGEGQSVYGDIVPSTARPSTRPACCYRRKIKVMFPQTDRRAGRRQTRAQRGIVSYRALPPFGHSAIRPDEIRTMNS